MAILGFLTHTLPEHCEAVEAAISGMPEMTTYGVHHGCYVVAVAEAPRHALEATLAKVHRLEGVLTTYVTSMTVEDEMLPPDA